MQQPTFFCPADAVFAAKPPMAGERIVRQDGKDEADAMLNTRPPLDASPHPENAWAAL
ncbi:MAG: hypothetical protein WBQ69_12490 [Gallionella sp.]